MPQTSVIIPTYNRPNLIGRAIKSVLNQTYQNFEIVVIDSSPDDETEKALNIFDDKRIKYIHNKTRANAAAARNQGAREFSKDSKYVSFADDDDEWLPEFLEKTVKVLEEKPDVVMTTSEWEIKSRDGKRIRDDRYGINFWEVPVGGGWVIRKEIFTKENFWYDERIETMEDFDFGVRALEDHKWESVPEVLRIYYIIPSSNETTVSSNMSVKAIELFYEKNYPIFRQLGKRALGHFYFRMGKVFLRARVSKKGIKIMLKAFLTHPRAIYLLFYLLSLPTLFFPNLFRNARLRTLKPRVFRRA